MLNFDLQNHRPLREIVYEQLKMQILTGRRDGRKQNTSKRGDS